ncbi:MAG TPA: ABC transporter ATP-binding protein [Solirubrobacteraceae bacterium]|nr:ABC transporter ATP-binding protein [Solirubrobacteraceae bacterium]
MSDLADRIRRRQSERAAAELMHPPAVSALEVTRRYGEGETAVDALRGVSLSVAPGELVAVMGPSGSGKSTLLHILAGLDRPTSGEALVDGVALSGLDDDDLTLLRREKVGFIFQFFNLLPMLSAEQNVVLPLKLAGTPLERTWIDEVIERVGLADRRVHRPAELSGGQQQRVAIARALVTRPSILFADEPTGNLDSKSGHEILELLRSCVATYGQTILTVTHEPRVSTVADRILLLADGLIVRELGRVSSGEVRSAIDALEG